MIFCNVDDDLINRDLPEYRDRAGFFCVPYNGERTIELLLEAESKQQEFIDRVWLALRAKCRWDAVGFLESVDETHPSPPVNCRKMRTPHTFKPDGEPFNWYKKLTKEYIDTVWPEKIVPPTCPKTLSDEAFLADADYWSSGSQGQVAIRLQDLKDLKAGKNIRQRNEFLAFSYGADRAVLRKDGINCLTKKARFFNRFTRKLVTENGHWACQGYNPDDFPHMSKFCITDIIQLSGTRLAIHSSWTWVRRI
jgi:hypothetical protein